MLADTLIALLERDLKRVIDELSQYKQEVNLWRLEKNISNSAGNLALHLVGNLNTYIGKEIGHTTYVRNRELEFSQKDIPRQQLIEQLSDTMFVVRQSLAGLTDEQLQAKYPVQVFSEPTSTAHLLVHLTTHLSYHLGQINYHRRLIDE